MAIVAIGAWQPGLSTIYDAITPAERQAIADLGICGEVAGVFLNGDGQPVPTELDRRMIVTPGPTLARIPSILAVAYSAGRAHAVRAALRGKLIKGLVTHDSLARSLLDQSVP